MFATIAITFIITGLSALTLAMCNAMILWSKRCAHKDREIEQLRRTMNNLNNQISDQRAKDQERREQHAYDRGLHDGRELAKHLSYDWQGTLIESTSITQ